MIFLYQLTILKNIKNPFNIAISPFTFLKNS